MAQQTDTTATATDTTESLAADLVGKVRRYPVPQPNGSSVKNQLILITGVDPDGAARGVSLGYEDDAARIPLDGFAD